jgi:hypothetical protein
MHVQNKKREVSEKTPRSRGESIYMTKRRLVSKRVVVSRWIARMGEIKEVEEHILRGWLQLSCGFWVYFVASSSRMLLSSWT